MYHGTYDKIQANANLLKRLHAQGNIQNLELFDEPYKLALSILDYQNQSNEDVVYILGLNKETVKQTRSALGI